jgi:prepilin-type processing-associated H-X9-DG protein/prepilin-type N-terminal cleavage/methylation domain-containing protein
MDNTKRTKAFTLVELLVVIGIIALLIAIMLPALNRARDASEAVVCMSNLRQIEIASMAYIAENHGYWPPAHYDFSMTNLHRWHGTRLKDTLPFDFTGSPLKSFLRTPNIKKCPSFDPAKVGFEASAGGYGYNEYYLGSSIGDAPTTPMSLPDYEKYVEDVPAKQNMIRRPAEKIAFADAALGDPALIEYSFVEPPLFGSNHSSPSIHFRHRWRANIAWADGHVTSEHFEWTYPFDDPFNVYHANNLLLRLGFFGPKDNSLYQRQ